MSTHPVADLRDLQAQRAAIRQYRVSARRHQKAGAELMAGGWFGLAGDEFNLADRLGAAALDERTCVPLGKTKYVTLDPPK